MLFDVNSLFSGAHRLGRHPHCAGDHRHGGVHQHHGRRQPGGTPALANLGLSGVPVYLIVVVSRAFNLLTSLTTTLESSATRR